MVVVVVVVVVVVMVVVDDWWLIVVMLVLKCWWWRMCTPLHLQWHFILVRLTFPAIASTQRVNFKTKPGKPHANNARKTCTAKKPIQPIASPVG
jgi:hypothetical protein